MSSPVIQSVPVVAAKATKTRKPTLPDKYGKFIQFAYYMMDNVLGEDFQMDKDAYLEKIKFFGSVEEQQILIQGFLTNAKENNKTIKKMIAARAKEIANANKPVKQTRTKKAAASGDDAEELPKRTARKPSTKKTVQADETDLLNDLVQQLTLESVQEPAEVVVARPTTPRLSDVAGTPASVASRPTKTPNTKDRAKDIAPVTLDYGGCDDDEKPVAAAVTETAKKPKKATTKKSKPPPPPEEDYLVAMTDELLPETFVSEREQQAVATKPKRKTTKKESTNATVDAAILTDLTSIPNTDIEITPITFGGVTYFTDKDSQLYAYPVPTAKSIGKYVSETQEVFLN